jgi:hypothetical protein
MNQNCVWWILARDTKVVRTNYWRDREVIHIYYSCVEHALLYGVVSHAKYGCTCSNLCAQSHLDGLQQHKTNEFLQHFILFEGHPFAAHFLGCKLGF